jgi:uncharacterized sporulation protein YeaH/YhbH (DUF444 family)
MATKKPRDPDNKSGSSKLGAKRTVQPSTIRIIDANSTELCPLSLNTHELLLGARINVPSGPGRDRTQPDKDRFKDRVRGKLDKDKIKDIIKNNPVFGDKGKIKVPVDGGKEPRWRPGRDGKGGGGKGRKGGKDPGDLIYIDVDYDEFVEWMFEDLELPFLERKAKATTMVKTYKMRGMTDTGPEPRINWEETEVRRIERGVGMLNAHPDDFPVLNEFLRRSLMKVLPALKQLALGGIDTQEAAARNVADYSAEELDGLLALAGLPSVAELDLAYATLKAIDDKSFTLPFTAEAISSLDKVAQAFISHRKKLVLEPDSVERLVRMVEGIKVSASVVPLLVPGEDIPTKTDCPLQDDDFIYQRVEIKYEPDSKCVVFLNLDRSGSMGGDPLAIAKFYFLLNILFLRTKYKFVDIVMIAHDAQAYEIPDEKDFYKVEVAGGTMFVPTYEMTLAIAQERYPLSEFNRYFFHATDGYMFDGDEEITEWWIRLISEGADNGGFAFGGYLEIDPYAGRMGGGRRMWAPGGQALLALPENIAKHVGMARVSTMDEVMDAFKAILTGDKTEA